MSLHRARGEGDGDESESAAATKAPHWPAPASSAAHSQSAAAAAADYTEAYTLDTLRVDVAVHAADYCRFLIGSMWGAVTPHSMVRRGANANFTAWVGV